jgi:MFS family permease
VLFFAAFVMVERRARHPLVPGRVVRAHGMRASLGAIFLTLAAYGSYLFIYALHLQSGLGFTPLRAGLTFVPAAATFAFASLAWPRVPGRWHRVMITSGLVLATIGLGLMALAVHSGNNPGTVFYISQVVFGLGIGSAVSPLITLALSRVAPSDAADASGMLTTTVQLAQVIGVATFGTLYLTLVNHSASGRSAAITTLFVLIATALAAGCAAMLPSRRSTARSAASPPAPTNGATPNGATPNGATPNGSAAGTAGGSAGTPANGSTADPAGAIPAHRAPVDDPTHSRS